METVKNIAAIVGLVLSIISLITLSTKGGRAAIKSIFKKNTKDLVDENAQQSKDIKEIKEMVGDIGKRIGILEEEAKQQCRNVIKNIYYKYQDTRQIPEYDMKTLIKTYDIYMKLGAENTYASYLYTQMTEVWDKVAFLKYRDQMQHGDD